MSGQPRTLALLSLLGRNGSRDWAKWTSGSLRGWLELDGEAELFEAGDQAMGFDLGGTPIEVARAEVVVFGAVLEDVIDGGEDRCGDGADGFLRSALTLQPEELGSIVAVFLALRRPGALDEHGLEPGRPLAQARGLALAGAFVLPGAQTAPGDESAGKRKTAHVATDLGKNRRRRHGADPGHRTHKFDRGAKGNLGGSHLRLHAVDPLIDFPINLSDRL